MEQPNISTPPQTNLPPKPEVTPSFSSPAPKFSPPLIATFVLLVVIVGTTGFLFGKSLNKSNFLQLVHLIETTLTPTPTNIRLPSEKEKLEVIVLKTEYGINNMPTPKYPQVIEVAVPSSLKDSVSAYGVGEKILIAPKNWTGKGSIGADGTKNIILHPPAAENERKSPYVLVEEVPACVGCAYGEAAYYFEEAKKIYEKEFPAPLNIPEGLEVSPLSPNLARYSLPDTPERIKVKGVAYFKEDNNQPYFTKMEIGLSKEEEDLAEFLLNTFISLNNLK